MRQPREDIFVDRITNKDDVELALRRAQYSVLNPDVPPQRVLELNAGDLGPRPSSLLFSQNIVCVDLEGPELTDLSFIDLPGMLPFFCIQCRLTGV
jgi:hypothetical protein